MSVDVFLGADLLRFRWREPWDLWGPRAAGQRVGWAHHGIATTAEGQVVTQHPDRSEIVFLGRDGVIASSWPLNGVQAHGLTVVNEGDREYLWIADCGSFRAPAEDGSYRRAAPRDPVVGSAIKYTLTGSEVRRLELPSYAGYRDGAYAPTDIAISRTGDTWVADGHGQHVVHRYDRTGRYLLTLDGTEGAGRFDHPHALLIDPRGMLQELLVADRGNDRIQVFDLQGRFIRTIGADYLDRPSSLVTWGEYTVVAEASGRVAVIDQDDRLLTRLGGEPLEASDPPDRPGARRPTVEPGRFVAPHMLAVDANLDLYVTEYLLGGRVVMLEHFGVGWDRGR